MGKHKRSWSSGAVRVNRNIAMSSTEAEKWLTFVESA